MLAVILGALLLNAVALSQEPLPKNVLNYGLQIETDSITGSGFLAQDESWMYFVTARQVLFRNSAAAKHWRFKDSLAGDLWNSKATISGREDERRYAIAVDLRGRLQSGMLRVDSAHDVAVLVLGGKPDSNTVLWDTPDARPSQKIDFRITAVWCTSLRKYDSVRVAADVYMFGFPTSIGLRRDSQIDYDRPLIQKGIVAGLNPEKKTIVLNVAANFGNSGGPVLELELSDDEVKFVPIGVATEYIPILEVQRSLTRQWNYSTLTSSPYSVAEPLDPVLDIIKGFRRFAR